jgi:two-component system chemotaxis response regulator CheB
MIKPKIRVLVVDDSALIRKILCSIIESDGRFDVVGCADNGKKALEMCIVTKPDVVSMDVNMPEIDGVEATHQIMEQNPTPIVIVSGFYQPSEVELAIRVLEAGAVYIMEKPFSPGHPNYEASKRNYLNALKLMSEVKVVRRRIKTPFEAKTQFPDTTINVSTPINSNFEVLLIGASAGGPESVRKLLENISPRFPLPVVFVQHIDPHFAAGFVTWLNSYSKLEVLIATDNQTLECGKVYMPPGKSHIEFKANKTIGLLPASSNTELIPSVNRLFESAAAVFGKKTIAVLLSGMGKDGAEMMKLYSVGALTYAQEEKSCLVFGMPYEAIKLKAVTKVLSPSEIAIDICSIVENK